MFTAPIQSTLLYRCFPDISTLIVTKNLRSHGFAHLAPFATSPLITLLSTWPKSGTHLWFLSWPYLSPSNPSLSPFKSQSRISEYIQNFSTSSVFTATDLIPDMTFSRRDWASYLLCLLPAAISLLCLLHSNIGYYFKIQIRSYLILPKISSVFSWPFEQ